MSDRIVMRVAESLVAGGPPGTAAEPEIEIWMVQSEQHLQPF